MANTPDQIVKDLIAQIQSGVNGFDKSLPNTQRQIMSEVDNLVKQLDLTSSGNIISNAKNLRVVGAIQSKLEAVVNSPEYKAAVKDYLANFNKVAALNDDYYRSLSKGYMQPPIVKELQKQTIAATVNSLTSAGISKNITSKIQDILRVNITSGASYADLAQQLRDYLTQNETGVGALERYTKQITTDALNQYSAQYAQSVASDLGFEWFRYTGAEIDTTRPFCSAMIDKRFFHISEIPKLLEGDFPEFKDNDGKINPKTGLPSGMVAGENPATFFTYRGGYNCGHQIVGVPTDSVPVEYRRALLTGGVAATIIPPKTPAQGAKPLTPDMEKAISALANYKPAASAKEAAKFANDERLAKQTIKYKGVKTAAQLEAINELNKALLKLKSEGFEIYDKVGIRNAPLSGARATNYTTYELDGRITSELKLNIGVNLTAAEYKRSADSGWTVSRSVGDTINHEYGHFLTKPKTAAEYRIVDAVLRKTHIPVSRYGETQGWEALAEIYALYRQQGVKALEADWITFFNKYSTDFKIPTK